jgi:NhaP-type Na+/H+ or K+/H+ antiporter
MWFLAAGGLLILMAVAGSAVDRLPMSPGLVYLIAGVLLGPVGVDLIHLDPLGRSHQLRFVCEIALIVSLFTVGLKLRTSLADPLWRVPFRLATLSLAVVVALVAAIGVFGFGLSPGAAVLLGAILAPTDPVLASDVQVRHANDRDRSRFALTAEGGLNDGIAFPFVLLGLGLLGVGDLGPFALRWLVLDVIWAAAGGIAIGWLCGKGVGHVVLFIRRDFKEAVGWDDFQALGLIALTYGVALAAHANGFLAVLAAGLAMRHIEKLTADNQQASVPKVAKSETVTHPATAPAHMVESVLRFNERFERLGELVVVLALGAILSTISFDENGLWLALGLFVVIRPVSVLVGLIGARSTLRELKLMSWFGIRGIGSLYYLMYAIEAGIPVELTEKFVPLVLTVVAASIAAHGISATPLMKRRKNPPR